jgi:hypothetical protein
MIDTPNFPGPGTAALFGAAVVFAAVGFQANFLLKLAALFGGFVLLIIGFWIE